MDPHYRPENVEKSPKPRSHAQSREAFKRLREGPSHWFAIYTVRRWGSLPGGSQSEAQEADYPLPLIAWLAMIYSY